MRVVIAEDEWLLAAAMRRQIESHGYTVVGTAGTGREALHLCRTQFPDLVLMDVQMPDMDGLEATRALMQQCPVCVVIVTGKERLGQKAAQAGAMSYITKPLLTNQIPTVVQVARQRFGHFMAVYQSCPSPEEALPVWQQVQHAVSVLVNSVGIGEDDAFAELERLAKGRSLRLVEAAKLITAGAKPGPLALSS